MGYTLTAEVTGNITVNVFMFDWLVDWFRRQVNPSRFIFYLQVWESRSLYVHIYIFSKDLSVRFFTRSNGIRTTSKLIFLWPIRRGAGRYYRLACLLVFYGILFLQVLPNPFYIYIYIYNSRFIYLHIDGLKYCYF